MPKIKSLIVVFLLLSFSSAMKAQSKYQFVTSKKVAYLKTRDAALDEALRKWKSAEAGDDARYHYNTVDLNGDGKMDAIVAVSGFNVCGSGGCPVLIFKGDGKNYSLVTEMSVSHDPVFVGATQTNGWKDLVMEVYGGGIKPYFALLKFDGKSYPENPTVEPALPKKSRAQFVQYLSGIEDVETGFPIK